MKIRDPRRARRWRARPGHRPVAPPLPLLHRLRARPGRRADPRPALHPRVEPDPGRGSRRRSRPLEGRRGGARLRLRHGRRRSRCSRRCPRARTCSSPTTSTTASATSREELLPRLGDRGRRSSTWRDLAALERGAAPGDPAASGWRRPSNPLIEITDLAGARRRSRAAPGALARGRQHLRHAGAAAAARARRRRRPPLDHQVPRRPQRRPGRRARLRRAADELYDAAAPPAPRARRASPRPSTPGWCCAGCARSPAAMAAPVARTRWRWRARSPAIPAVAAVHYPGLAVAPRPRVARAADARLRRHALLPRPRRPRARRCAVGRARRLFTRATSLGGVESLIEHRASSEGPASPTPQDLLRALDRPRAPRRPRRRPPAGARLAPSFILPCGWGVVPTERSPGPARGLHAARRTMNRR